jgi:hypothetical protein
MENTLLTSQDQYYIYDGDQSQSLDENGFTIGGHESEWLADLVAACIFLEHFEENFSETFFCNDV